MYERGDTAAAAADTDRVLKRSVHAPVVSLHTNCKRARARALELFALSPPPPGHKPYHLCTALCAKTRARRQIIIITVHKYNTCALYGL